MLEIPEFFIKSEHLAPLFARQKWRKVLILCKAQKSLHNTTTTVVLQCMQLANGAEAQKHNPGKNAHKK